MNNSFLTVIKLAFDAYLDKGPRSTAKIKLLHGKIAMDIATLLGKDYKVYALGYNEGKEKEIIGRYMKKKVDIAITDEHNKMIAGIGVKFVMSNYSQNSNNYFENMLGETANIRCARVAYFQVLILQDTMPYFNKDKKILKWENVTLNNISKYSKMSEDDIEKNMHTPIKTLLFLVNFPCINKDVIKDMDTYIEVHRQSVLSPVVEKNPLFIFDNAIVYNAYETYLEKVSNYIKSI